MNTEKERLGFGVCECGVAGGGRWVYSYEMRPIPANPKVY